ncbi:zinc finger CW-type PWWP domain protein 1-like isoform X2 [Hyalella azteca]|uniref:Zinc finger CW-type PWWP domain protein 1-like isoform X2 n=1 Tax=Hyalella azteca TaxID=294128 RepID=A0A979FHY8_HYAAZ|nr:zinc finger CW-type PWWP domain protein 1-like isoform X2 [Hyalella azteca]
MSQRNEGRVSTVHSVLRSRASVVASVGHDSGTSLSLSNVYTNGANSAAAPLRVAFTPQAVSTPLPHSRALPPVPSSVSPNVSPIERVKSPPTKTKQTNFNPAKLAKNCQSLTIPSIQEQPWTSAKKKGAVAAQFKTQHKSSDATRRRRNVAGSGGHPVEDLRRIQNFKEHMLELQQQTPRRAWVQCDDCDKWRELTAAVDPANLPERWTCPMNTDAQYSSCQVPEAIFPSDDPDYFVYTNFTPGSVVWVQQGRTRYPAMVDDDPDTDIFFRLPKNSNRPNWYHVMNFESPVCRNWVRAKAVSAFTDKDAIAAKAKRSSAAAVKAATAKALPMVERRKRYCVAVKFVVANRGNLLTK